MSSHPGPSPTGCASALHRKGGSRFARRRRATASSRSTVRRPSSLGKTSPAMQYGSSRQRLTGRPSPCSWTTGRSGPRRTCPSRFRSTRWRENVSEADSNRQPRSWALMACACLRVLQMPARSEAPSRPTGASASNGRMVISGPEPQQGDQRDHCLLMSQAFASGADSLPHVPCPAAGPNICARLHCACGGVLAGLRATRKLQ